ncbi:MAG: DeoR/GlpR family DNA-binding transcription regulator [Propionibacteriaceae bacterium]|nr:DeoR/GlpR family DNA-binding transcription regulator [Propionibacteriaceae bacterium]
MLPAERRRRLVSIIVAHGSALTAQLASSLGVSEVTIRSDLAYLERTGSVRRTHGGAVATTQGELIANFATRAVLNWDAKLRIARAAAALIRPGEAIIVDAGTTTYALAQAVKPNLGITVFTHGINVAQQFASLGDCDVFVLGGVLSSDNAETIDDGHDHRLDDVVAHYAFLGAGAVDADFDVTEASFGLVTSKRNMARAARRKVLLADSSKWSIRSHVKAMPLASFDIVITDDDLPKKDQSRIRDLGIDLRLV